MELSCARFDADAGPEPLLAVVVGAAVAAGLLGATVVVAGVAATVLGASGNRSVGRLAAWA